MSAAPRLALFADIDEPPTIRMAESARANAAHSAWLAEAAGWTVREAYDRGKRLALEREGAAKATFAAYATHLKRWDKYWAWREDWQNGTSQNGGQDKYRSVGPILSQLTRRDLEAWRDWLLDELNGSNVEHNVNKHIKCVQAICQWAERQEIIAKSPAIDHLKANTVAAKLYFTYDQCDRLYAACSHATWPDKTQRRSPLPYSPARYWRAMLVMYFHYGFRPQELVRWESEHQSLTWANIWWDSETPAEDGHATNEHGWLWYVPQKQADAKPDPVILPLTAITAAHLRSIIPPGGADPERPVFDFPLSPDSIHGQWYSLCELAGVRPKPKIGSAEQPRFFLAHWRKTCTTWANKHRPGLGPLITGHADRELTRNARATATLGELASAGSLSAVNAKHYDHSGELAVVEGLNSLPIPESFRRINNPDEEQQRTLFD